MTEHFKSSKSDNVRFSSQIIQIQGHSVLVLSGEIDAYTALQFQQSVMSILDSDVLHLIVDMYDVWYMDSSGMGVLLSAMRHLSPLGGSVKLVGCNQHIACILNVTKISTYITLHQNMDDALKALAA